MRSQFRNVAILFLMLIYACSPLVVSNPVEEAQSRIQIGDSRDDAVQALSDAWFHAECTYPTITGMDDLFLYGPKDPDRVEIVIVSSDVVSGNLEVVSIGGFESYMLSQYNHCIPSPLQVFEEETPTAAVAP